MLSECTDAIKRFLSVPLANENLNLYEKLLSGDFSCVNTRIGFNTDIVLVNIKDFSDLIIDESFAKTKMEDLKVLC